MAAPFEKTRDKKGRFAANKKKRVVSVPRYVRNEHSYTSANISRTDQPEHAEGDDNWKEGRRIVEFGVLLSNLRHCEACRLGPVALTYDSVVGELQKGLGGYLYVKCSNNDCNHVNRVPYGSTHRVKKLGMPCFAVNTKLGTAMIDSLGGPDRVNNVLAALNLKPISQKNLKMIERRAGNFVESIAKSSMSKAAKDSFELEMEDVGNEESKKAQEEMGEEIDGLGVSLFHDASPSVKKLVCRESAALQSPELLKDGTDVPGSSRTVKDIFKGRAKLKKRAPCQPSQQQSLKCKKKLVSKFPTKTRSGMSCAVDTAWQKRGFDSLTSHTFFMSKAKYGKKVVKTVVSHRTCGTCKWWQRNRPGQEIRKHRCVHNHTGSARLMESVSGVQGIKELIDSGTPVDILEGDGDNTMISRIKSELGITMKKRLDKNHVIKNIGKRLYALHGTKGVKLSKTVIVHLQKCIKYALAKNQTKDDLEENLKAILPHQFGDHSCCAARFCGFKRNPSEKYIHRSLPYKAALKNDQLRQHLQPIFDQVSARAAQYVDLGSSQQCEHANKEVTMRIPKSLHYGNSDALDFRVHATAAFINEGRGYISKHLASG
ncbi:uncharacterized protein [Magallana gigas]|uniref:uncharacterized protein isoform X2 n=1 Tax=Magallana gigas TaxID=29159 RepID=UPI00333E2E75